VASGYFNPPSSDSVTRVFPAKNDLLTRDIVDLRADPTRPIPSSTVPALNPDPSEFDTFDEYLDFKYGKSKDPDMMDEDDWKGEYGLDTDIRTYHEFEAEHAEKSQARRQIEGYLYMFGYTFEEFVSGEIPEIIAQNLSSSLFNEFDKTLGYYARVFKCSSSYSIDALDNMGTYRSYKRDDFEPQNGKVPF